jgi:glyoxylase-like metal-dependent hydrolase (beta-lactamase superfamily II)
MPALEIGRYRITLIRAGSYWWDGGAMFGVVPKTLWSKHQSPDELNRVEAAFNCFLIDTDDERILIETGGGVRHDERARKRMRMPAPVHLSDTLKAQGVAPDSIDVVINTHLHWDHCGGNTVDEGPRKAPSLPRARYVTQRGETMHARERHPRDAVSYRPENYEPLIEAGRMQLLDGDAELAPGVELRVAPGHNRDMMIVIVRSGHEVWCEFADLMPYAAHVTPTWVPAFDLFPLETIATKTELLKRAAEENWWCSFGHDPSIAFAKIGSWEGKWQVEQSRR